MLDARDPQPVLEDNGTVTFSAIPARHSTNPQQLHDRTTTSLIISIRHEHHVYL